MSRYLITGFQAFGEDSENPTELLLQWIREDQGLSEFFETQLLPVVFETAAKSILDRSDLSQFKGLIHFGLAAGRSKISLERVGLNWIETSSPDNGGVKPEKGPIDLQKEKVYFTRAPIEKIKSAFQAAQLPVEISLSAGGYVCNHLYFQMLKANLKPWVLFIHIPYLDHQVVEKPNTVPSLTEANLKKMLKVLVQSLGAD